MDLRTHFPYSLLRKGIINSYPSLQQDMHCDVAIIGAGITGALIAWHLHNAGIDTAVFDKRHAGIGSTAASTGMLQYEIDIPLHKLVKKIGYKNAVKSYLLCRQSISDLGEISKKLKTETTFIKRNSFQYASYKKDADGLKKEYKLRKEIGISIEWMDEKDIQKNFGFSKTAGVYSEDGGEIDAYAFTHALLQQLSRDNNVPVYDHTEITNIVHRKRSIELITAENKKIIAKKLVIACGYESQKYLPRKVERFFSTYAAVSEPSAANTWYNNSLIWETASPYLYLRTTVDSRILIGGLDDDFTDAQRREKALTSKTKLLTAAFNKLFPAIPFRPDFNWAGTFASTKDGLPYIDSIPELPNTYFALGYGGNGITFSVIAAQIICDILSGMKNKGYPLFSFNR